MTKSTKSKRVKRARKAVLAFAVQGKFAEWPKGMAVIATPTNRSRTLYDIERDPWVGALTIMNVMAGVPAYALQFPQ